jgi:2-polyprenyl-6-methoxyphenol hydroxylase-like FAD-dependent oxidoreductase
MLMLSRSALLEVLRSSCARAEIRRGVVVRDFRQHDDHVEVELDDGGTDRFDVVIACDGMRSTTRTQLFGEPATYDSGWTLWTWWYDEGGFEPGVVREWWGAGSFFGAYPTPGACMCAAGGPRAAFRDDVRVTLRTRLRPLLEHVPSIERAIDELEDAYPWPMSDVRSSRWVEGRMALCGDAAVGFMPTAGVGASNAMRAAAALADELSRAGGASVPLALELYEKRCRRVVERNQTASRRLARVMFVRSRLFARVRDAVARRYPAERALGEVIASVHEPF